MFKGFGNWLFGYNHPGDALRQDISPDAMIVNGLIQSFASEFEDWAVDGVLPDTIGKRCEHSEPPSREFLIRNDKKKLILKFYISWTRGKSRDGDNCRPFWYHPSVASRFTVNGQELDGDAARAVFKKWIEMSGAVRAAKEAADRALADMKASEAKWNIAEQILGMRRTKTGRMIAESSYCAVCDSHEPEKGAKHNLSCQNAPQKMPRRPKVTKDPFVA